jgi:hypothetical protein
MSGGSTTSALCLAVLLLSTAAPHAEGATLLAIGSDPINFVPDQLILADIASQSVSTIGTLGDGSLGFNGGLAYGPGGLYAIGNDSTGAGSFYQVQPAGALSLVGSPGGLGFGFYGGLTFDPLDGLFYGAVNDSSGNASLYSITASGVSTPLGQSLGAGFSGLAFDSSNGRFYGIGNDSSGFSSLYDFTISIPVSTVAPLGFGFGGLTYDAASDSFWVIAPVSNSGAQLFQIASGGAVTGPVLTLGDGFFELAAPTASTPEPGTSFAAASCLLMLAGLMKFLSARGGVGHALACPASNAFLPAHGGPPPGQRTRSGRLNASSPAHLRRQSV